MEKLIHIDLFSGIGGFSLGLQQAGVPISKTYFSEIDKHAISVYRRNFPYAEYLGSVDTIPGRRFKGRKTIITFGFPCQDLSVAGKRKGFDGSRSSLFFEAMRIIDEVRPDIFIFENVKGFYSSNDGKDFTIALQTIADLGVYECQWQLLNTSWFLPQNRERIYFVGSIGDRDRPKVFPIRECDSEVRKKGAWEGDKAGCLGTRSGSGQCNFDRSSTLIRPMLTPGRIERRQNGRRFKEDGDPMFSLTTQDVHGVQIGTWRTHKDGQGFREIKTGVAPSLCGRARNDGSGQPVILSRPHGFNKGGEKKLPCLKASSFEHNEVLMEKANAVTPDAYLTRGARNRDENGKAVLTSMCDRRIRRLTPIECERLQGFPDNWTQYGHEGQLISDTQRYKMCGNAVSIPPVKAIGERLK